MNIRHTIFGIISLIFICIGLVAIFFQLDAVIYWVLFRSGLFMGAVWLALPQLTSKKEQLSTPAMALTIVLIMLIAIRPKVFLILGSVAIAAFLLQGVVRRLLASLRNK